MLYSNSTYTIQRLGVTAFIFFHLKEFVLTWKSEQLHELYPPPEKNGSKPMAAKH